MRNLLSSIVSGIALIAMLVPTVTTAQERDGSASASVSRHVKTDAGRHMLTGQPGLAQAKLHPARRNLTKANPSLPASAATVPSADSGQPIAPVGCELRGAVIFSDSWEYGNMQHGMYTVPTATGGQFDPIKVDPSLRATGGATCAGGKYYSIELYSKNMGQTYESRLSTFDATTWELEDQFNIDDIIQCFDMTYDATTGYIYASIINYRRKENYFGIFNPQTGATTKIKDLPDDGLWTAIMADATGQIYAIDGNGVLLKVNKKTGDATIIGSTGVKPQYVTGGTIEPQSGRCFWSVCNSTGGWLYEIDLNTGGIIGSFNFPGNEEVAGLYFDSPLAEGSAPAAATGLSLEFDGASLSGNVRFTAPSTTFDGSAATGTITYTVLVNGNEAATGETQYGTETTVPLSVDAAGDYDVAVCTQNEAGRSPYVVVSQWIGSDAPVPVGMAQAAYADGRMTISWEGVTQGVHGGNIDPDRLTYEIVRYPDGVCVADAATGLSFTDELAEPDRFTVYHYTVTSVHNGVKGDPTETNRVPLGVVELPYGNNFLTVDDYYAFTTIDVDDDGKGWTYDADWKTARAEYHSDNAKDDWLMSPSFLAEAGKQYELRLSVAKTNSNANLIENFDVWLGAAATVEGMTQKILDNTVVTTPYYSDEGLATGGQTVTVKFKATETGRMYIGVHACTAADSYDLHVLSLNLSAGVFGGAPAAPAEISAVPDWDGGVSCTISCEAPSADNDGNAISSLTKLELLDANGLVLDSKDNPEPGSVCSFVRAETEAGYYTYGLRATNAVGQGEITPFTTYVGTNVPQAPASAMAVEEGNTGKVTISWEAPAADCDGRPLNPDLVTYDVVELITESRNVAENHSGLSFTYQAASATQPQVFAMYSIYANTAAGRSARRAMADMLPVGAPYELPYAESFAGGHLWHILGVETEQGDADWNVEEYSMDTPDGDNCYLLMQGHAKDDRASVATGKISLVDVPAAMLRFSYCGADGGQSTLEVQVSDGGAFSTVATFTADAAAWQQASVDLAGYSGKTIRIRFVGTVVTNRSIALDGIKISNAPDIDLAMAQITVPGKMEAGSAADVNVVVANTGRSTVSDYSVELYLGGQLIQTLEGTEIEPNGLADFIFNVTPEITAPSSLEFYAAVVCPGDGNADNNITGTVYSTLTYPNQYAEPTGLTASADKRNVTLGWTEPVNGGGAPIAITDDFESYTPWTFEGVGGWTLVDMDNSKMGGLTGITLPEEVEGKILPFFVFDSSYEALGGEYAAHSGDKQMCSMYIYDTSTWEFNVDDWMISPELYGTAQTVSFYARSYSQYLESFEVYYSTTDKEIASFQLVEKQEAVPQEWTRYTFDVPEGARYFAIRCTSNFCMMLGIDDVTFAPAGAELEQLTLVGYNVYRDGVKLNASPVEGCSYTDAVEADGTYSYLVTAVYDKGESRPSAAASVLVDSTPTGIYSVTDTPAVSLDGRTIVISGDAGRVEVYSLGGATVFSGIVTDGLRLTVGSGIYMVKIAGHTTKLVVR